MNAQSPSAYSVSVIIHGTVVALFLVSGLLLHDGHLIDKPPQVFELVAGEGDNYNATEAPALGTPGGVKIDLPKDIVRPAEEKAPEPPQPEPDTSPVTPAAVPVQAVAPPKPKKEVPIAKQMERIMKRKEEKIVKKFRAEQEAREKAEAKARALESKRLSKEEYERSLGKGPRIDAEGIAKGVVGGSTKNKTGGAGGKALSREEQDQLDSYFAYLKQKIKAAHEPPDSVSDSLRAKVSFVCAANGAIGAVKIYESSGNSEYDQSVVRAVKAVSSVGPRPDGKSDTVIVQVSMKDDD